MDHYYVCSVSDALSDDRRAMIIVVATSKTKAITTAKAELVANGRHDLAEKDMNAQKVTTRSLDSGTVIFHTIESRKHSLPAVRTCRSVVGRKPT